MNNCIYSVEDFLGRSMRLYFTNLKQAEDFCEYCNMIMPDNAFMVITLFNGERTDYRSKCDIIDEKMYGINNIEWIDGEEDTYLVRCSNCKNKIDTMHGYEIETYVVPKRCRSCGVEFDKIQ